VKFMLIIHMNPEVWEGFSPETQEQIGGGHGAFQEKIRATGEMISTHALAEPGKSAVVRRQDTDLTVTDGPYLESKEFLAGYYLIEAESRERALEIASMMPEVSVEGLAIEVREVIHSAGANA
jgi:hypothetical protein